MDSFPCAWTLSNQGSPSLFESTSRAPRKLECSACHRLTKLRRLTDGRPSGVYRDCRALAAHVLHTSCLRCHPYEGLRDVITVESRTTGWKRASEWYSCRYLISDKACRDRLGGPNAGSRSCRRCSGAHQGRICAKRPRMICDQYSSLLDAGAKLVTREIRMSWRRNLTSTCTAYWCSYFVHSRQNHSIYSILHVAIGGPVCLTFLEYPRWTG